MTYELLNIHKIRMCWVRSVSF